MHVTASVFVVTVTRHGRGLDAVRGILVHGHGHGPADMCVHGHGRACAWTRGIVVCARAVDNDIIVIIVCARTQ
jgi:hypothetical protein